MEITQKKLLRRPITSLSLGISVILAASLTGCGQTAGDAAVSTSREQDQPNVLMILLDDLGYTDLGAYGGEVETSNIDALAQDSAQFTDFYATPLCAPTRAALMTGQDPHQVGLGSMEGMTPPGVSETTPGYKGSLEGEFTGIAEVMSDAGYETFQVGKWHLGGEEEQTPQALGFDQNFTLYDAGASYFSDGYRLFNRGEDPVDTVIYERNGTALDELPEDFFATRAYTDEMLEMIESNEESEQPFFAYLGYTAPHDPLHVENKELIDHYLEIYLDDYNFETLRAERIERMAELGLIDEEVATAWPDNAPTWDSLTPEQREDLVYRMAVYAAVIHETDEQVGRIIDQLKETGEYDDTLIVLASDNGPSASTQDMYEGLGTEEGWHDRVYPLIGDKESYGLEGSFPSIALPNALVSSGPYFHAKNTLTEGGIRVPAMIKSPSDNGKYTHQIIDSVGHITDLYPTFADYAGATLESADTLPGHSARGVLEGTSDVIGDDELGWEHFGQRAYRAGEWKLAFIPELMGGTGDYALYNLANDPGETTDVIDQHPEIAEELTEKWEQYAATNGVAIVDFDTVNKAAPASAEAWYRIDWATN